MIVAGFCVVGLLVDLSQPQSSSAQDDDGVYN